MSISSRQLLWDDGIEIQVIYLSYILRVEFKPFKTENLFLFNEGLKKHGVEQGFLITQQHFANRDVRLLSVDYYRVGVLLFS